MSDHKPPTIHVPMMNPGRAWIRTTYQLSASILADVENVEDKFRGACRSVINWVKVRGPDRLPQAVWNGESFRGEWPGQKVETIAIPDIGVWSFRWEHPDMPYGERPAVPGRTWTTDVVFIRKDQSISVGIRTFCASLPFSGDADIQMTRPRIVLDLVQRFGMFDSRKMSRVPWLLTNEQDLQLLRKLLVDRERILPVVVLTQPDKTRFDVPVADYVLDPHELAKRCCGLAHVVQLPWDLGFKWTGIVGKPMSAYLGAVRTYMPGLDLENDLPVVHPSTFADKILFWKAPGDDRVGEAVFTDFLVEQLFQKAATRRINWGERIFLPEARSRHAEFARQKATGDGEWKDLYDEEIAALNQKIAELEKEAEEYSDDAIRSNQEREAVKEENRQLRYQLDHLRQVVSDRTDGKSETDISIPDNYEEMPDWVNRYLLGRVVLHSRALRGVKYAVYEDVSLVYRSLLLLANEYRDQCLGNDGANEKFKIKCSELGLSFSRAISKERAGEQGDEYFVRYPMSSSPKQFLEWHLRKGASKNDKYCLGIYFFWDDATRQVVIGWLPGHLDNRMS